MAVLIEPAVAPSPGWRFRRGVATPAPAHRAPAFDAGLVPARGLLRRLTANPTARLALLVAPAGYGKTTLLSEWAQRDGRPFAWISLDEADNDPCHFGAGIEAALASLHPPEPYVLVLDHAEVLHDAAALEVVGDALDAVGPGSILAIASRREPQLPLGRLRAQRVVTELDAQALAMSRTESAMLLTAAGIEAESPQVTRLTDQTEGWPVGLYLAALSLSQHGEDPRHGFAGDDRLLADYLREELLSGLSDDELTFVRRTSILDRLSGPLCDAVLERRHSGGVLRDLARGNVLIETLDPCDREFRYHPLFAAMLQGELRREDHESEAGLHERASAWHERHGDPDGAVEHAIASGDRQLAGRMMWSLATSYAFGGRAAVLGSWLGSFGDAAIAACPTLALTAAVFHFVRSDGDRVEHWLRAAEQSADAAFDAAGGARVAAVLRAGLAPVAGAAGTEPAVPPPDTGLLALQLLSGGVAAHLAGDRPGAAALLREGSRVGIEAAPVLRALSLAQLAVLAAEAEDWEEAALRISQAYAQIQAVGAADDPVVALVYAVRASVDAHRGHPETARREARHAKRLLAASRAPAPWLGVEAYIWLARTAIRLSDIAGARALLAQAARLRRDMRDGDLLEEWIDGAWGRADAFSAGATGVAPTLTMAELRVLRFLPSHLSFREIGDRLHVSANTVKTQALAVYRKLDVSSRSEAVERGCAVGLLDG